MPQRNKLPGELLSANADRHCTGGSLGIRYRDILDEQLDGRCLAYEVADWLASVQQEDQDWRASYLFQRWMAGCIVPRLRKKGLFGSRAEVEALGFQTHEVPSGRTGFSRRAKCPLCPWEGIGPSTPYLLRLPGTGEPAWTRNLCRMDLGNGQSPLNAMRVHFGALPACPAPLRAFPGELAAALRADAAACAAWRAGRHCQVVVQAPAALFVRLGADRCGADHCLKGHVHLSHPPLDTGPAGG